MALDLDAIRAAVESHALASGYFERVNGHEPENAPGLGISAAVWVDEWFFVKSRSGLNVTSTCVLMQIRLQTPVGGDEVDPALLTAADALMRAYSGDFELGGQVAAVDLLGMADGSPGMRGKAGYLPQDDQLYRVLVITLPLLVDNLFDQAP